MTKQTRRRFSPEYKEQSVARLSEPGATHSSVAAELGVTPTQLKTWVFPSPLNPARPRTELDLWKRLRKLARLEGVRIHDLRHTFASQAAMQGIPLPVVARLLGHAQVQMTLRYAHVSDRDVEAAAERIGGVMAGIMDRPCFRPEPTP